MKTQTHIPGTSAVFSWPRGQGKRKRCPETGSEREKQKRRTIFEVAPGVTAASLRRFRADLIGPTKGLLKRSRLCRERSLKPCEYYGGLDAMPLDANERYLRSARGGIKWLVAGGIPNSLSSDLFYGFPARLCILPIFSAYLLLCYIFLFCFVLSFPLRSFLSCFIFVFCILSL